MTLSRVLCIVAGLALCAIPAFAQETVRVSGFVVDASTGERLAGATVWHPPSQTGTVTNAYGFFALRVPVATAVVRVSFVGYASRDVALAPGESQPLTLALEPQSAALQGVTVTNDASVLDVRLGAQRLDPAELRRIPALGGEADLLRTLQLLPGVQGGAEGTAGFFVRGGSPDQNLILVDDVPVYNVSHLFGFLSVFNADALRSVELYTGSIPARYGGRLSSVLDIGLKEGHQFRKGGNAHISMVASRFLLEGPLGVAPGSYMVSGRRSFIDPFLRPVSRRQKVDAGASGGETQYAFYDLNAKVNLNASRRDRVYLSFYQGADRYADETLREATLPRGILRERKEVNLTWGNRIGALRWNRLLGQRAFLNTVVFGTRYALEPGDALEVRLEAPQANEPVVNERSAVRSFIADWGGKTDLHSFPAPGLEVRAGGGITRHRFRQTYETRFAQGQALPQSVNFQEGNTSWEGYLYGEVEQRIGERAHLGVGVHAAQYLVEGKVFSSLQPRVGLRLRLRQRHALALGYSALSQPLHLVSNSGIGLPTDVWVGATRALPPQRAWQVTAGHTFTLVPGVVLNTEVYYKPMKNLVELREGASFFVSSTEIADKTAIGTGEAYGLETMLRKTGGRTTGWVAYTLSRSDRTFREINDGKTFPFTYDRRHDVAVVVNHALSSRWTLSSTWVFSSGRAVTLPLATFVPNTPGSEPIVNVPSAILYSARNAYRYRPYHRLDLGAQYERRVSWGSHVLSLSVYNTYNRLNTFFVELESGLAENGADILVDKPLFPLLPGFSYGITF